MGKFDHTSTSRQKIKKFFDIIFPVVAITVTVVLLTQPIIFFYISDTDSSNSSNNANLNSEVNITNCSLSWSEQLTSGPCTYLKYEGTFCKNFIKTWKTCIGVEGGELYVHLNGSSVQARENEIIEINTFLTHHTECQEVVLPFFCQYQLPLQDCSTGIIYSASREDCIDISTGVCAQLWSLAMIYGYEDRLPQCHSLPTRTVFLNNSQDNNFNAAVALNITCRDDFIVMNSTCIPRCDKFDENSQTGTLFIIYSEIFASITALLVSLIIIILSIKAYKTMCVYPSILVLFEVADCCIIASLVLIISMDRSSLMCNSISILESLENPTAFCTLSGALFHYAMVNLSLSWFFHICIFFHRVLFPFHANRMSKLGRDKYIFVTVTVLSIVLPIPAIAICLSVDQYKYKIVRFPPSVCVSFGDMWFYSVTLIVDLLMGTGMCLLIIVFWVLHKRNGLKTQLSTAEKKIVIVFSSFLVFTIGSLAYISDLSAKAEEYNSALMGYFQCEALGYVPGKCDRRVYQQLTNPYVTGIVYALVGLIPLSILNYVLKWKWVKKSSRSLKRSIHSWKSQTTVISMVSNISVNEPVKEQHNSINSISIP